MSVTYPSSIDQARLNLIETAMDSGLAPASLTLTASNGTVVSIPFLQPAGSVSSLAILTFLGVPLYGTATITGSPTAGSISNSNGNIVATMTAGPPATPAYDITISPDGVIRAGQVVALLSGQIIGQ